MKRVLAMLACAALTAPLLADSKQVLSPVYPIDRKYKSMEGPSASQTIYLGDPTRPELVWITGIRTEVVAEDGHTPALPDLMCHVNVDIDPLMHRMFFNLERMPMARLLTISQGMLNADGAFTARLPRGFGFPFTSSEPLYVMTQVLNLNLEHPHLRVRHRVTFEYTRDADLKLSLRPLLNLGASAMVVLSDRPTVSVAMPDSAVDHGPSCAMPRAPNAKGMSADYTDAQGRKLTGHWVVPPGRQENKSDIGIFLNLPYDTKIHYAAIHLHPFAESLTLRDVTAGTNLVVAHARSPQKRLGLDHVDTIYSDEGIPLPKGHRYELISVYNNTSGIEQDSMASMFFGLDDPEYAKPTKQELAARMKDWNSQKIASFVLHTTAGDILATFQRDEAPAATKAFIRLLQSNALTHARVGETNSRGMNTAVSFRIAATDAMKAAMTALDGYTPVSGATVALCPLANDELSFELRQGPAPENHRCRAFARVVWGDTLIRTIATAVPKAQATVEITKTDVFGDGSNLAGMTLVPAKPLVASR
jgi:hypothetical protein